MFFDMHTHSRFSCDADSPMDTIAELALKNGLAGVAVTDHMEWIPEDDAYEYFAPQDYFAELEIVRSRYAGQLELLAALELGNPHQFPQEVADVLSAWPWDYTIGSLHWTAGLPGWEPVAFEAGVATAYQRYFTELVNLARDGEFDVLGHLDLVRRDSWSVKRQILPLEPYADLIRAILAALVQRGKGLEINTSPWDRGLDDPCPGLTILRWYRELGGEILVFGSDAHNPRRVGQYFPRARDLALAAGFTHLVRFKQRQITDWCEL